MRQLLPLVLSLSGVALLAQATPDASARPDSPTALIEKRIVLAKEGVARIADLVQAGALPRMRLAQAQDDLADVEDEATLARTLYGSTPATDWNDQLSEEMVSAAERRVDREQARVDSARKLVDAGIAIASSLAPLEQELTTRQLALNLARSRAHLLTETAALAKFEQAIADSETAPPSSQAGLTGNGMEHYQGNGWFDESRDLAPLEQAFQIQFDHPLPISADGETDLHRALGFDHRGRVDVAINPGDPEGVWLRRYLQARGIPYYAFTHAVPGKATAAHIHIGPGSTRLHNAD